ncbi:hypothetical protein Ccrd_011329 [Cynara cardunculus var. scolymus]|uniref:DnaJ domain-containing protein n=1 Tax=Cynara cardunculus var. scolymus TaxID=59895 RepID=A0A103YJQ8_CYNCS|nr:hypothetical protein Ccrd_011329 [Cynara cardunculus var. scolymus]
MGDIGVLNQGWKWLLKESLWCSIAAKKTVCGFRDTIGVFTRQHWPNVCYGFGKLGKVLCFLMIRWKDCFIRGCGSLFGLGTAALLVIIWSCFLSLTSMSCLLYLLLGMGTAGCAVCYLGFTPGLLVVGLFSLLVLRMYVNFLIVGPLFIVGVATVYALYHVKQQIGWSGVLISINLAFLSCDALICMLQSCDNPSEKIQFEEQKVPESFVEDDFSKENKSSVPFEESEQVESCKSSSKPATSGNKQKKASTISIPVVKNDKNAINEMKRILECLDHYEALGFSRYRTIDATSLKKEYKKKVLSDSMKKRDYDELLRNEELKSLSHKRVPITIQRNQDVYSARNVDFLIYGYVQIGQSRRQDGVRPNTHRPSFHVNMVGLEKTQRCSSSRYPWDSDAEMTDEEEEFDLWLQQAVASGFFCETSKRRKSWSRFKLSHKKVKKQWTRMSRWSH